MTLCYKCGEPAPYACDAVEPGSDKKCGRTCCEDHALPRIEGAEDIGRNTLCEDHAHLQKRKNRGSNGVAALSSLERLNPTVQFTPLAVDGRTYQLCYDFNAIATAEKVAECNLLQGMGLLLDNGFTAAQFRGLLYAALLRAHPEITANMAGSLIRLDTMTDIRYALLLAYNQSLPEQNRFTIRPQVAGVGKDPAPAGSENDSRIKTSGTGSGAFPESISDSDSTNS